MNYFTDQNEELKDLICECMEGLNDEVKTDYLINCLTLNYRKNMMVEQIFEEELRHKKEYEKMIGEKQ